MKFEQLYSGSKHNLYTVTANNGKRLMIECGVSWDKLQKSVGFDLDFEAALLTHEHKDHSKAVVDVMAAGIDVYSSAGTFEALGVSGRRANAVVNEMLIDLDSFQILAFDVQHDAKEPLGYIIYEKATKEYLLFATDTSHIVHRFPYPFSIIALECSYNKDILQQRVDTGDINEALAKRLLTSHTEKQTAITYLKDSCNLSKCREIHLLHMSKQNLNPASTVIEFENEFNRKVVVI